MKIKIICKDQFSTRFEKFYGFDKSIHLRPITY